MMDMVQGVSAAVGLIAIIMLLFLAGCEGSPMANARNFREARAAYTACVKEKGETGCQAELNVMNATARVDAAGAGRTIYPANQTLGVYRIN